MKIHFDHENLDVYQEAIVFCGRVGELLGQISARAAAKTCCSCEQILPAKERLVRVVNTVTGMLKRFSGGAKLLREDEGLYAIEHEQEHG